MQFYLKELSIQRFRGVDSDTFHKVIACEKCENLVPKLIGIYGENGSGKTTIAEAMRLLFLKGGRDFDSKVRYLFSAVSDGKVLAEINVKVDSSSLSFDNEPEFLCLTCNSPSCSHVRELRTVLSRLQNLFFANESSSVSLFFYHQFMGREIAREINLEFEVLKEIFYAPTGLCKIRDKYRELEGVLRSMDEEIKRIKTLKKKIQIQLNSFTQRLGRVMSWFCDNNTENLGSSFLILEKRLSSLVGELDELSSSESEVSLFSLRDKARDLLERVIPTLESKIEVEKGKINEQIVSIEKNLASLSQKLKKIQKSNFEEERRVRELKSLLSSLSNNGSFFSEGFEKIDKRLYEALLAKYGEYTKLKERLQVIQEDLKKLSYEIKERIKMIANLPCPFFSCVYEDNASNEEEFINCLKEKINFLVNDRYLSEIEFLMREIYELLKKKRFKREELRNLEIELEKRKEELKKKKDIAVSTFSQLLSDEISRLEANLEEREKLLKELKSKEQALKIEKDSRESEFTKLKQTEEILDELKNYLLIILSKKFQNTLTLALRILRDLEIKLSKFEEKRLILEACVRHLRLFEEKFIDMLADYLSTKISDYFLLLTEHQIFREVKIHRRTASEIEFEMKVRDIWNKEHHVTVLNGQARTSLILALQIASLEMLSSLGLKGITLLVLDDPTQAYDKKHKKNFCKFIEQIIQNTPLQVIVFTFDTYILDYDDETGKFTGTLVEDLNGERFFETIEMVIRPPLESRFSITDKFIRIKKCECYSK